ncbi:hypothetical protein D8682_05755 [Buttiauxella sp. 3AFRM03]|uniref:phage tail-collar fiber domain-containing protein n=1 Tax=Buttiauxella sp. 3AFRM03 TaxID=2479367 RepID=UPI000EF7B4F3|nr:phage tail protein [Buttiauxella sp. 3AFRM03]AYN26540.1 hypothetical protein D8682_05755 [Buttiauxella sp. 3AFRM03]
MSHTIITAAFESYLAGQIAAGEVVTLDEFIFAWIDGLDPAPPISPDEVVPAEEDIVWRQAVDKTGVVNEDAVVYSVTLGTNVGDFAFNWVGLINHDSGMLGAVTHIPTQDKYATTESTQGNILTRSFLMGYAGAKLATQISTPAETWQIDFSARLSGMDERQRMENIDLYGVGAFFDTGFLVTSGADGVYTVAPGAGYVGGLRVELSSETPVAVAATPVKIWVDAHWTGTVASIWNTQFELIASPDLQDHTLNGYPHYVFAIAEISETGEVTDLRPKGTLDGGQQANKYVLKSENLSDLPDKAESRSNLELGTSATKDAQETPTDATPGRLLINGGWGLGSVAIDMTDGEILSPFGMQTALFKQGGGASDSHFGAFGAGTHILYGSDATVVHTANMFVSSAGHLTAEWLVIDKATGAIVLRNAQNLYGPLNKPTAGDVNAVAKTGDTMTGALRMEFNTTGWPGGGMTSDQLANGVAPLASHTYVAAGNMYLPLTKAVVQTAGEGYQSSSDFGVLVHGGPAWPSPCITSVNDRGEVHQWIFDPNLAAGSNSTRFTSNGNILGAVFRGSNLVIHLDSLVNDVQYGAMRWQDYAGGGQVIAGSGEVLCGLQEQQDDNEIHGYWFKPQQKFINGIWVNVIG